MNNKVIDMVELFNVGYIDKNAFGYRLERYPEGLYKSLSTTGAYMAAHSCGCEIRFVMENPDSYIQITLLSESLPGDVTIMCGDYWDDFIKFKAGEMKTITIKKSNLYDTENNEFFKNDAFSKRVIRIILSSSVFTICDIKTFGFDIRPPYKSELPKLTGLAYGSSITHGAGSITKSLSYVEQLARGLNSQIMNKGLGGSCLMESSIADWFAELSYDYMIFEAGANMYDDYNPEEIEARGKYMLKKLLESHPDKYIFMLQPPMIFRQKENSDKFKKFSESVYNIFLSAQSDKCVYIENCEIQKYSSYVSSDLIHPSTFGHILMGENLANKIKPYLK